MARSDLCDIDALPPEIAGPTAETARYRTAVVPATGEFVPLADELAALERARIEQALNVCNGVKARAAGLLSMPLRTFHLKLRQYGIDVPRKPKPPER